MRVISFRHEQHAGNAAAAAGFLTGKPGICLTVSAPGLPQRPDRAGQRDDQLLPDDPDQRLERARDRRPAAGRLRGDGPARHRQAPCARRPSGCCMPQDIGVGIARAIRAAVSGRPGGVYLDLPAKLFAQTMDAAAGKQSLVKVVDPAPRQIPAPDAVQRALASAQGRQAPADRARQGRRLRPGRRRDPRAGREDRHPVPADVDGQGPAARQPRAVGIGRALLRAGRGRRGDAGRRAPELAAVARQGQDLGRTPRAQAVHPDRHRADRNRQQRGHRRAADRRHRLVRVGTAGRHRRELGQAARPSGPARSPSARTRTCRRWRPRWRRTRRR